MLLRGISLTLILLSGLLHPFRAGATSWAFDFVRFHGITYSDQQNGVGRLLTPVDLGPVFDTVRFRILGTPCEYQPSGPGCRRSEGVALSLQVGTAVYLVKGYPPTFRLAAYRNGVPVLFEAVTNPRARQGGQLLVDPDRPTAKRARYSMSPFGSSIITVGDTLADRKGNGCATRCRQVSFDYPPFCHRVSCFREIRARMLTKCGRQARRQSPKTGSSAG